MKNIYLSLMTTLLLIISGVGQVWAEDPSTGYTFNKPYLYYLNTSNFTNCSVIYGRKWDNNNYTKCADMAKVSNTSQLYYVYVDDYWNNSYNQIAIIDATGWGNGANNIESRWTHASNHSGVQYNYSFDYQKTYYLTSSGNDNISISYKENGYNDVPKTITTLQVEQRNSTGEYSTPANDASPATVTLQGTHMSGNGTTGRNTVTWAGEKTYNVVISGLVTTSYANLDANYVFDGWYIGGNKVGTETSYEYNQSAATTVVAKFSRVKYTVTFDQQSGADGSTSVTATYGSDMPEATMPTRTGFIFSGYFTGENGTGTKYYNANGTSAQICDLTTNVTLYAYWEAEGADPVLTWNLDGGTAGTGTITPAGSVAKNTVLYYSADPTKTGYTFNEWDPTMTSGTTTMPATSTTYTAQWTENMSVVTVTTNGVGSHTVSGNTSAGVDTHPTLSAQAAKSGYSFTGWTLTGGISLADGYEASNLQIQVKGDGNKTAGTATANYAEVLTTGWYLVGSMNSWNTSTNQFMKNTGESAGSIGWVELNLTKDEEFKIYNSSNSKYYANASTKETVTEMTSSNCTGWTFDKTDGDYANTRVKITVAGTYKFQLDCSTKKVSVTYPTSYIITYGSNLSVAPAVTSGKPVAPGTELVFTAANRESFGYTFDGFYKDGAKTVAMTGGTREGYKYTITPTENIEIHAKYTPTNYSITYNVNGGDEIAAGNYNVETATFALPTPTRSNFSFRGWYDNEAFTGDKVTQIAVGSTGNKIFYAKWKQCGFYLNIGTEGGSDWTTPIFTSDLSTSINLTAEHKYQFSIRQVTEGADDIWWKTSGYTFTESGSHAITNAVVADGYITTAQAGAYTFTLDNATPTTLTVTYPSLNATFTPTTTYVKAGTETTVTLSATATGMEVTSYRVSYSKDGASWTQIGEAAASVPEQVHFTPSEVGEYRMKIEALDGSDNLLATAYSASNLLSVPELLLAQSPANAHITQLVTLTPSANYYTGSAVVCYSFTSKPAASEVTDFTDAGENKVTFTPDVEGDYTIMAQLKTACPDGTILAEKQLTVHAGGAAITVRMRRDPLTYWEHTNYIYYYNSSSQNAEWPGVPMTYLGKDEEGYPWYSYEMTDYLTYAGGTLIFSDGGQKEHQTVNITMPGTDACYLVKPQKETAADAHKDKRLYELIADCPSTEPAILLLSGTENQYQGVEYVIEAKGIFMPGELSYIYEVSLGGSPIALNEYNAFTPAMVEADQSYQISVTAHSDEDGVTDVQKSFDVTMHKNNISLASNIAEPARGTQITLTTTTTLGSGYKFTYTVIEPGTRTPVTITEASSIKTANYTVRVTGAYIFKVIVTDASGTIVGRAQAEVTVAPQTYWVKYPWNQANPELEASWVWKKMTHMEDGMFMYYGNSGADASTYSVNGANVVGSATQPTSNTNYVEIANTTSLTTGTAYVFLYDAPSNTLTLIEAGAQYRIKSVCQSNAYYSNTIGTDGGAISFFAEKAGKLILQKRAGDAEATWQDQGEISTPVTGNNVWQAMLSITDNGTSPATGSLSNLAIYSGNFYVHTPLSDAKKVPDNGTMTRFYNDESNTNEYFNHYYMADVPAYKANPTAEEVTARTYSNSSNAMATVGNDINENLAGLLPYYELPAFANVRFAYNNTTNHFSRTFLTKATTANYLTLYGTSIKEVTAETVLDEARAKTLDDMTNWVYSTTVRCTVEENVSAKAALVSTYDGKKTWLLASSGLKSDDDAMIDAFNHKVNTYGTYTTRVTYDFKTNRVQYGWIPSGDINTETSVNNVLVTRKDDGAVSEFSLTEPGQVVVLKQMTTEIEISKTSFQSWNDTQTGNGYKTLFYWITLPYNCQIWNIFGFAGTYSLSNNATSFEIQRYRGDLRAAGTAGSSAWRKMSQYATMEANQGYVLAVRLKLSDFTAEETATVRFFFPSAGEVKLSYEQQNSLTDWTTGSTADIQKDWHVMGVPVMQSGRKFTFAPEETGFESVYRWTWADGGRWYEPVMIHEGENHFNFMAGHAYMVQGHGTLTWNYTDQGGTLINAPKRALMLTNKDLRIDLMRDEEMQDKTYVIYRENGTRDYELGRDLLKIENVGRAMLYSELSQKQALLCLADTDHVQIPLTVVASEAGEYSLQLGYAAEGIEPVLYDAQEGTTTLLSQGAYTVELQAGTYQNRFFLGVQAKLPQTPTATEQVSASGNEVVKYLDPNGRLLILKQGHLYDAFGHTVQ